MKRNVILVQGSEICYFLAKNHFLLLTNGRQSVVLHGSAIFPSFIDFLSILVQLFAQ